MRGGDEVTLFVLYHFFELVEQDLCPLLPLCELVNNVFNLCLGIAVLEPLL
jgi:hypothetical protein